MTLSFWTPITDHRPLLFLLPPAFGASIRLQSEVQIPFSPAVEVADEESLRSVADGCSFLLFYILRGTSRRTGEQDRDCRRDSGRPRSAGYFERAGRGEKARHVSGLRAEVRVESGGCGLWELA